MKILVSIFCLSFLISCSNKKAPVKPIWLVGNWERTNDESTHKTYETWTLNSDNNLIGKGLTVNGKDTIFSERLSIISKNDTLYLQVIGVHEDPTLFKFTKQTDTSFISENPTNEFPKVIRYFLDKELLKAEVSNDDFKLNFIFKRLSN